MKANEPVQKTRMATGSGIKAAPAVKSNAVGVQDNRPHTAIQKKQLKEMTASPAGINGNIIQGNFLSKLVGNTVSDLVIGGGAKLVSSVSSLTGNTRNDEPWFGPLTGRGFGTFAESRITKFEEGGEPSVDNPTWDALLTRRTDSGDSYYIRGHLLNQHLGGPGYNFQNLTPLTRSTNSDHSKTVEEKLKTRIAKKETLDYRVQAVYGRWPWEWPSYMFNLLAAPTASLLLGGAYARLAALKDAEQHIPMNLYCSWWVNNEKYSENIRQRHKDGNGFWVRIGNMDYDLSKMSSVWDLIEGSAAAAIKAYLFPALIPYLTTAGIPLTGMKTIEAAMSPVRLLGLLLQYNGGGTQVAGELASAGWSLSAFIGKIQPFVLETISEAVIRKYGGKLKLPNMNSQDPQHANRELNGIVKSQQGLGEYWNDNEDRSQRSSRSRKEPNRLTY